MPDAAALSASPAVVSIQVSREVEASQMQMEGLPETLPDDLFEFFFGPRGFGRQMPQPRNRGQRGFRIKPGDDKAAKRGRCPERIAGRLTPSRSASACGSNAAIVNGPLATYCPESSPLRPI